MWTRFTARLISALLLKGIVGGGNGWQIAPEGSD